MDPFQAGAVVECRILPSGNSRMISASDHLWTRADAFLSAAQPVIFNPDGVIKPEIIDVLIAPVRILYRSRSSDAFRGGLASSAKRQILRGLESLFRFHRKGVRRATNGAVILSGAQDLKWRQERSAALMDARRPVCRSN